MSTAAEMVTEVVQAMHGFGQTTDRTTILSNAIGPADMSFQVDYVQSTAGGVIAGIVEIDSEQIMVASIDQTSNTCTVANGGRGWNGTAPASHAQYTKVVSKPKFPRFIVLQKMNEVIGALYPDLFGVATYQTTVTFPQYTYTIPNVHPLRVLTCEWQDPLGQWHPIIAVSVDQFDGTVRVGGQTMPGRPLRFIYAVEPQKFASEGDDFTTQTLLPESTRDVVTLGAQVQLMPSFDVSRAQNTSVEQQSHAAVAPNAGINLGTYLQRQFSARLSNERDSLRYLYRAQMRRNF